MFGNVVLDIDKHDFDQIFDGRKKKAKAKLDTDLTADDLQGRHRRLQEAGAEEDRQAVSAGRHASSSPCRRDAVFRSWCNDRAKHYRKMNKIPDDLGTAVNVQAMVFGNLGDTSATGVGFTRNPGHRREGVLRRVPGERAGRRRGGRHPHAAADRRARKRGMPTVYNQLREITTSLEKHYRDMQDFEFTIQDGKLYMLQTRNGKRTGPAAVRIAVDMVERRPDHEGRSRAARRSAAARSASAPGARSGLQEDADHARQRACRHPRAPPSARVVFTADDAVDQSAKAPVILVRKETTPDDIHGMEVAKGILTSRGGMTSHAAVVARGMGTPCVAGAERDRRSTSARRKSPSR